MTEGSQPTAPLGGPTMPRRIAPAVGLFFLAPLVGEYLLGNISIDQIALLVLLAPMYGGGALLVREVARRAGRGWSTILLLAMAYGLLEEGVLDQLLFNPSYYGLDLLSAAYIPALGMGAAVTVTVLAMHAVWSISIPIALVEALVGDRGSTPWLGRFGLTVTSVVFLLGSAFVFHVHQVEERFLASAPQLAGTAVVIAALIVAAFAVGRRRRPGLDRRAPHHWQVGAVSLTASSLFFLAPEYVPDWMGVGIDLLLAGAAWVLLTHWSRRQEWGDAHRLAAAGGAMLTYVWLGFVQVPLGGSTGTVKLVGNTVFALGVVALLAAAIRTVRRTRGYI